MSWGQSPAMARRDRPARPRPSSIAVEMPAQAQQGRHRRRASGGRRGTCPGTAPTRPERTDRAVGGLRPIARAADRGVEQLDRMRGGDRAAGASQCRGHLEQAARVCARVDVRLGCEHLRRLAVAERARRLRLHEVVDARRCRSTAPARPARPARAPGSSAASPAAPRARAGRGRGGRPPDRRRAAAAARAPAAPLRDAARTCPSPAGRAPPPSDASRSRPRS